MEIHGNVFTVWSVWGTEYQSSVSSGDCPFRRHYLMDGNIVPSTQDDRMPILQRDCTEAALFPISNKGQPGEEKDPIVSHLL